ncbi:MAG TPA: hypothetical protein VIS49_13030 [Cyclobacteriaceae bacterium]
MQTLRISTQPLYAYLNGKTYDAAIPYLIKIDQLVSEAGMILAIGPVITNDFKGDISDWALKLIQETRLFLI